MTESCGATKEEGGGRQDERGHGLAEGHNSSRALYVAALQRSDVFFCLIYDVNPSPHCQHLHSARSSPRAGGVVLLRRCDVKKFRLQQRANNGAAL